MNALWLPEPSMMMSSQVEPMGGIMMGFQQPWSLRALPFDVPVFVIPTEPPPEPVEHRGNYL